jgi:hypothetical protein
VAGQLLGEVNDLGWIYPDGTPVPPDELDDYLRRGTLTASINTSTGATRIDIPPAGLNEPLLGTTVTDGPQDNEGLPWWAVGLGIGGAVVAGTEVAKRINDPTTPGSSTVQPPTTPVTTTTASSGCRCNGPLLAGQTAQNASLADIKSQLVRMESQHTNPVTGFAALQTGQAGILTLLQNVNTFMRKAWEMTRMQKVLDVLTFIGVMHNVAMLSRDVGETFFQVVGQGIQAVGIRDEEGQILDVNEIVTGTIESMLRGILSDAVYEGVGDAWNRMNRIISSASAIIWTVRSIGDASLDLMEWVAENTGKIGNALKRWGVVGERDYPWMSERAQARNRIRTRFDRITGALDTAEDRISNVGIATSGVIEVEEEITELGENFGRFRESVVEGVPDPWADNIPIQEAADEAKAEAEALPDIPVADTQKG